LSNTLKFSLAAFLGLIVFGIAPVFATDVTDSSPWQNTKNYAMLPVRVLDCSPYGGDSDDDGICDNWESNSGSNPGLHINFVDNTQGTTSVNYRYDISCVVGRTITGDPTGYTVCPSPAKKDIYVELDWMSSQAPDPQAIADVVKAYNNSGIALHVQYGENPSTNNGDIGLHYCDVRIMARNYPTTNSSNQACSPTTGNYQGYPYLKQNRFGTMDERAGNTSYCPNNAIPTNAGTVSNPNSYNCLTAKRQVFHYGMLVDYQFGNTPSSGWSEITGNDFVVSLGSFIGGVGSIDEQEGAIMHELGHNFGLHHGGNIPPTGVEDDDNCKPNYPSIMSYTYQFRENNDICRPLDYSNAALSGLNEPSLTDSNVGSYQYPSNNPPPPPGTKSNQPSSCPTSGERSIWWSTPNNGIKTSTTGITNDWNQNAASPYVQNINNLGVTGCNTSANSTLNGFNDWGYIMAGNSQNPHPLNFRTSTNFYQSVVSGNDTNTELAPLGENVTEITSDAVKGFRGHHLIDLFGKLKSFNATYVDNTTITIKQLMDDAISQNNNNNVWGVYDDLVKIKNNLPPVVESSAENRTATIQNIDSEMNSFATAGTVPEFGPVAAVILAISFISIMIISKARFRVGF